jgi:DNA primase
MNRTEAKKILHETLGRYWDKGSELLFSCPSCNHHKHKFSVNLDKNAFKCWICDYRGRNIRRVIRRHGSFTQLQKWDQITDRTDISRFAELFMDEQSGEGEAKLELPQEFVSLANKNLPLSANRPLRYLKERGIMREDIVRWKIGFCYDGEYGGRIIIPSFGTSGYPNYFIARSYVGHGMKYKNPHSSKNVVFNDLFTNWNNDLAIVEGVFDAINAGNSVPILGSTLREDSDLLRKIVRNDTPCYIALDPDAADKERRIIQTLLRYDVELYKIDVSGYEDVGEMPKATFQQRKESAKLIDRGNYILIDLLSAV